MDLIARQLMHTKAFNVAEYSGMAYYASNLIFNYEKHEKEKSDLLDLNNIDGVDGFCSGRDFF